MPALPTPGGDSGIWGGELNTWLTTDHNSDGTHRKPWQFYIDAYGAKGDGIQALVTTVAGSAVINTTPIGAPAAPTLATATTGGTVAAGTYLVIVTFVNRWGESTGSTASSITTTGTTSTITISSPTPTRDATGWYAYVTQAGGGAGTQTRQQTAGSPTNINAKLVLTAPPTNTGASVPGSDTTAAQVFTSTAVDSGKNIMINGGLGSPGTPWVDTISTVSSPTQATLSSNGASQGGNVSVTGAAAVFASDDRLAIDNCIQAARAYAQSSGSNFVQVIGSSKNYGLGTGFFQSVYTDAGGPGLSYNAQIRIPVINPSGQTEKLEFQLIGPGANSHAEFWVSDLPNLSGCTFISFSVGPTTADATYGQQCVISSPVGGANVNGSAGYANVKAVIRGIQVVLPGWSNSVGIALGHASGCEIHASAQAYAPSTNTGGGVNPSSAWIVNSFFQNKLGVGLALPGQGNNDDVLVESFATEGVTSGVVTSADHVVIDRLVTINLNVAITLNGSSNSHALKIAQWSFENVNGGLDASTVGSGPIQVDIQMDGENTSIAYDVNDPNGALTGIIRWRDNFRTAVGGIVAPTVNGGQNVQVVNDALTRQVYAAPTYTLGTAFRNPWWSDTWIQLAGGTVTNVQIGPTSAACTTSIATSVPALPGVTFRVPTGWWLNISGSVKPTTFNAVPA